MFFGDGPNESNKSYAYHFDARLVAEYFKEIAISRSVKWLDGEVIDVKKEEDKITLEQYDKWLKDLKPPYEKSLIKQLYEKSLIKQKKSEIIKNNKYDKAT